MNWHQVRLDDVAATAWRNGGGVTRELLAWPHAQEWVARLSVADIEADGPFSAYPGVTRWFAVLAGEGVHLTVDGRRHELDTSSGVLRFDGASAVQCGLLDGPTRDFNLMVRGHEGRLERLAGLHEKACRKGALVGVYSHDHPVTFLAVEVRITIPPRTLAWAMMPMDERIEVTTPGGLWFEVAP